MDYEVSEGGILLPAADLLVGGRFQGQIVRAGEIIEEWDDHNLVVDEGLNALLNVMFDASTQITNWYLGIFEGNYTPVASLTAATVASASTESTAYTETTRQAFTVVASTAKSITNSAATATFTFNATKTIYGAFLISDSTKSGTAGTLFAAARFSGSKSVVSGDQLVLTYTFTAASS